MQQHCYRMLRVSLVEKHTIKAFRHTFLTASHVDELLKPRHVNNDATIEDLVVSKLEVI